MMESASIHICQDGDIAMRWQQQPLHQTSDRRKKNSKPAQEKEGGFRNDGISNDQWHWQ